MSTNKIIYWAATALVLLFIGLGSFADILKIDAIKESFKHIGFPEYFIQFFGVMKLLGAITIIVPALKRLREGAYAGMIFYFLGATFAHLSVSDGADKYGTTLFILASVVVSYLYSPHVQPNHKTA